MFNAHHITLRHGDMACLFARGVGRGFVVMVSLLLPEVELERSAGEMDNGVS